MFVQKLAGGRRNHLSAQAVQQSGPDLFLESGDPFTD